MENNKTNIIKALAGSAAALTAAFAAHSFIHQVPPMPANACSDLADGERTAFRLQNGYLLNLSQRNEFLRIGIREDECRRKARENEYSFEIALR